MQVLTAQLPGAPIGDDRVFVTTNAVIMLDGASAFIKSDVPTTAYVDALGAGLMRELDRGSEASLVEVLRRAIERVAADFPANAEMAPSSTVAIARQQADSVEILVLGDTQIVTPDRTYRDDRIAAIGADYRRQYRERLAAGHGYDAKHRELLRYLQGEQLRHRNQLGGYWIAERDPAAAENALTDRLPCQSAPWLVIATDGAYRPLAHLGLAGWNDIAKVDELALADLLRQCHAWEVQVDANGSSLPRAKCQDDKTLAAVRL